MKKFLVLAFVLTAMLIAAAPVFGNGVVHFVSAGGPDACYPDQPGCDSNYSLNAVQYADGSVKGQFTDKWTNGYGFHAKIDCLVVEGNEAWVSGVITSGRTASGFDLVGIHITTRVKDNGTSANDPLDQISGSFFSWPEDGIDCNDQIPLTLWDTPQGQVNVD